MFNPFKKKIEGDIGYFNLQDWWLTTFTQDEREHIEKVYQPMGSYGKKPLTEGKVSYDSLTEAGFLCTLAGWFCKLNDISIGKRIIDKAYQYVIKDNSIISLHFTLQTMMKIYYSDDASDSLEKTIHICWEQINLAPQAAKYFKKDYPYGNLPAHAGYERLAIIYEKEQKYDEAIAVCIQAKQQSWLGDWDKRIERMKKKQAKDKNQTTTKRP